MTMQYSIRERLLRSFIFGVVIALMLAVFGFPFAGPHTIAAGMIEAFTADPPPPGGLLVQLLDSAKALPFTLVLLVALLYADLGRLGVECFFSSQQACESLSEKGWQP
jgi:hypothetical protein